MIRSMTGFGRSSFEVAGSGFEIEIRTVNHRHLDTRVRLPRLLADWEHEVKALVQQRLKRGKVDISVVPSAASSGSAVLEIDEQVARQYLARSRELAETHGLGGALDVTTLLSLPGVSRFSDAGLPGEALREHLQEALERALAAVDAMREQEGRALLRELESRLARIGDQLEFFAGRAEVVQRSVREKLRKRSEQLAAESGLVDEARLHQEIVIHADRLDVTEEIVRLRSHVEQFQSILGEARQGLAVGRRLEFLLQEMGREANTIGSKANDAPLAHQVVELKTELERIREQVLNVE